MYEPTVKTSPNPTIEVFIFIVYWCRGELDDLTLCFRKLFLSNGRVEPIIFNLFCVHQFLKKNVLHIISINWNVWKVNFLCIIIYICRLNELLSSYFLTSLFFFSKLIHFMNQKFYLIYIKPTSTQLLFDVKYV